MKLKLMPMLAGLLMLSVAAPVAAQACTGDKANQQLTPQQQSRLEEIRTNTLQQVEAILTTEQQQQFQNALASGQKMRPALTSLNLSQEQQTQVQTVMQSMKQQKQQLFNSN